MTEQFFFNNNNTNYETEAKKPHCFDCWQ